MIRVHVMALLIPSMMGDHTSVTLDLNKQIESGDGAYNKGKGVLVRTPDFFNGGQNLVVPATFWVNDIITPSQLYPEGNPWCPKGNSDGFFNLNWQKCTPTPEGPWHYATVAAVVSGGSMNTFFRDFDNIQSPHWGWGVFYATDANAADSRCKYDPEHGYNCPGGWVSSQGKYDQDSRQQGAGFFPMGNPDAGLGGGGAGCHFDKTAHAIDQANAFTQNGQNLIQDKNCQCNYHFNKDWDGWVKNWILNNKQSPSFPGRDWLGSTGKKAPSWAIDTAACWVNNPRDMISMQNAIYRARHDWNNGRVPETDLDGRAYWGWNEIPVTRVAVDAPSSWTAVMIKLPADVCGMGMIFGGNQDSISCLNQTPQQQLEKDLDSWVSQGKLLLGQNNLKKRPGSYIVLVREFLVGAQKYHREFFCESWTTPSKKYMIKSIPKTDTDDGACYLESAQLNTQPTVIV
jgi:hypothetical protein